jgi:hypothetical protein
MAKKISRSDAAFDRRFKNSLDWVRVNMAARGYDQAYINDVVVVMYLKWEHIYTLWLNKQQRTRAMTALKNATRKEAEVVYAELVRMIRANENTTDAERIALEIAPVKTTAHEPLPVTNTAPVLNFVIAVAMQILIYFREKDAKRKGLPIGAEGIEFRWAVLDHDTKNIEELTNIEYLTKGQFLLKFKQEDRGKFVRLAARWRSPSGEMGPWTLVISVMIP